MRLLGSLKELVSLVLREDNQEITVRANQSTSYSASRDVQLPPGDAAHVLVSADSTQTLTNKTIDGDDNTVQDLPETALKTVLANASKFFTRDASGIPESTAKAVPTGAVVGTSDSQTLTNKTIDADSNTLSNIENADIKAAAAIDATKIADGSVTNTEFQYISTLSSNAQTQIDGKQADVVTTKGDLVVGNGSGDAARLAVGTNAYVLTADSAESTGIKWAPAGTESVSAVSATGGTLTSTSDNVIRRNPSGGDITLTFDNSFTAGQVRKIVNSGSSNILCKANDASLIRTVYPNTTGVIQCTDSTPADSSSWISDRVTSGWIDGSSAFTLSTGFGTTTVPKLLYRREGKTMIGNFTFRAGTVTATTAYFDLPSGLTLPFGTGSSYTTELQATRVGIVSFANTSADVGIFSDSRSGAAFIDDAVTNRIYIARYVNNYRYETVGCSSLFSNTSNITIDFEVQISEWEDFKK